MTPRVHLSLRRTLRVLLVLVASLEGLVLATAAESLSKVVQQPRPEREDVWLTLGWTLLCCTALASALAGLIAISAVTKIRHRAAVSALLIVGCLVTMAATALMALEGGGVASVGVPGIIAVTHVGVTIMVLSEWRTP